MNIKNVLAAVMLSAVAACGGGGGGDDKPTPPPATGRVAITAAGPTAPVGSGGSAQFDVMVSNTTGAAATNVAASLNLGSGLALTGITCTAASGATCPADPMSMTVASLPANGSLHFVVLATVAPGMRGTLAATASMTIDGALVTSDDQVALSVHAFMADVQVAATAPSTTQTSGGVVTYTMTVTNAGPDASSDLILEDDPDTFQTLGAVACAADGGATCPAALGGVMTVPSLPAGGKLVFSVPATIASNAIGGLSNTLVATPAGDTLSSNNSATATVSTALDPHGSASYVALQSDSGDYIGGGQSYIYSSAVAKLTVSSAGGTFHIGVSGDDDWNGDFAEPGALTTLKPGTYQNLTRFAFRDPAVGGIDWSGNGRGCNTDAGTLTIDAVTYAGTTLTAIDLHFEQHCEGGGTALRGQVHWLASDTSQAPGPRNPAPASLWRAPVAATPTTGNYVYLQSDAGDYIGGGATNVYTQANASLAPTLNGAHLGLNVTGNDNWSGDFAAMSSLSQLQPGYYANLRRYPFNNPVTGGMSWSGDGRGCNTLTGWFVIDSISVVSGSLASVDLRFEQHCEGGGAALRGQVHWVAGDPTRPPGPQTPVPTSLWRAPAGATPAAGNYVYLQSDAGDYIGAGATSSYTQANSTLTVSTSGAHLSVGISGVDNWSGDFQGMNSITQLQPGYYAGLVRYPFNNPVAGGLSWSGNGRGCNTLTGWFAIDSITIVSGALTAVDLRFEQHCEGGGPALHGQVHWVVGDNTKPPGPQNPAPAGLWTPPAGSTPASGNFVYLQSDAGDYIGQGATELDTAANSTISVTTGTALATIGVGGWSGEFKGMNSITQLQPGYYPNLQRFPFNNPTTGGIDWSGNGRGCNTETGWFVVDSVTYSGTAISALDLRFEQHCEGGVPALHGKIHWSAGSTTQ